MLKTNGTLLLLLPAAGHGRNPHGACSLTMDGSTEDVLSSILRSALSISVLLLRPQTSLVTCLMTSVE